MTASTVLEVAGLVLTASVSVAALAVLLIVLRVLTAIRAYVGVLAALPEITPQVTVQQPATTAGNPEGTHAHVAGPWPRAWQAWFEQMHGAPRDEEGQTEVHVPPPQWGDQDYFGPMPPFGPPAKGSKARQDLSEEER